MSNVKDDNTAKRPKTEADIKSMTNKQYLDQVNIKFYFLDMLHINAYTEKYTRIQ
jgi:hypothetical protein